MKLQFVGTGSGKTSLSRFHSSLLIEKAPLSLLVDAGDSVSKALLKLNKDLSGITHIIISHFHADHFAGLPSLITQMYLLGRTEPLKIIVHKNYLDFVEVLLDGAYLFREKLPFSLEIDSYEFQKEFKLGSCFSFVPVRNSHISKSAKVENYPDELFVSSSFVFYSGGLKILYTSDLGGDEDISLFKTDYDIVIAEFTHVSVNFIFELLKISNPRKLYLTHIDEEKLSKLLSEFSEAQLREEYKIFIANDGDVLNLKE